LSSFNYNVKDLRELIPLTAEKLSLPFPMVIEKDLYVTKAISALSNAVHSDDFKLIFKGGSCLAKIGLIKRLIKPRR